MFERLCDTIGLYSSHLMFKSAGYLESHDGSDDGQNNESFHSDFYAPTFKCFLYLEDVNSYPFEYISSSHLFSLRGFYWHFRCQLKFYLSSLGNAGDFRTFMLRLLALELGGGSFRLNYCKYCQNELTLFATIL